MLEGWIDALVDTGRIADIAMLVIFVEAVAIGVIFRKQRAFRDLSLTLASGFALLGALRVSLSGGSAGLLALWLIAALAAHAMDLYSRLHGQKLGS